MTKPGPHRKPRAVQALLGNPAKRRLRNEPVPLRRGPPKPPAWLSPYARAEWRHVVDELVALGLAAEIDRAAIAAHCENVALMQTAAEVLQEMSVADASRGILAKMPSGAVVQNPVLGAFNTARRDVLRSAAALGLCAAGRASLESPEPPEMDAVLSKYFARDNDE